MPLKLFAKWLPTSCQAEHNYKYQTYFWFSWYNVMTSTYKRDLDLADTKILEVRVNNGTLISNW